MYNNSYELTGIYYKDKGVVSINEHTSKRIFILQTIDRHQKKQYIKMEILNHRQPILDRYKIGDRVKVMFNIKGVKSTVPTKRESNEYKNHLNVWRVEKAK